MLSDQFMLDDTEVEEIECGLMMMVARLEQFVRGRSIYMLIEASKKSNSMNVQNFSWSERLSRQFIRK
jgi:hypothetical protein